MPLERNNIRVTLAEKFLVNSPSHSMFLVNNDEQLGNLINEFYPDCLPNSPRIFGPVLVSVAQLPDFFDQYTALWHDYNGPEKLAHFVIIWVYK